MSQRLIPLKFYKVYVEITNICGLSCSFCPTKIESTRVLSLQKFDTILFQLQSFTNTIALHVFGDPLTLSNLKEYLNIASKYNLKVEITTTGYYLKKFDLNLFLHPSIKQINFSLNSYNKNEMNISLEEYLKPMLTLCDLKLKNKIHSFINFRLWNLEETHSELSFNHQVLTLLFQKFHITLKEPYDFKSIRLENQILIHFDNYFQWPSLDSDHFSHGYCHGLSSQIAILSSGVVVPCCLDSRGVINLGNIFDTPFEKILQSEKVKNILTNFQNKIAIEELCQKCTFKERFNN